MSEQEGKGISRRQFLQLGVGSVGTVLGVSYLGLAGAFLNPQSASAQDLKEIGKVGDFPEGKPKLVAYDNGGVKEGVYVINFGAEGWLALDFHCTHLQCAVNWVEATKQFMCPCHGGVYDIKGNVVSGPPPKSLPMRVIKVKGDTVSIGGRMA